MREPNECQLSIFDVPRFGHRSDLEGFQLANICASEFLFKKAAHQENVLLKNNILRKDLNVLKESKKELLKAPLPGITLFEEVKVFGEKTEKVESQWKINLFAKGTRKKLAMEREKIIWKVLVVHDRKYHLFLPPGAGRKKVVGERKRVQRSKK